MAAPLVARGPPGRMPRMRIGVLTGGGDCPGLNAVIRGVVRAGVNRHGHEIVGFRYGWGRGLDGTAVELTPANTAGILHRGGTILGTSRTNPFKGDADGTAAVRQTLEAERIDALIPIGGEDTLRVAGRLAAARTRSAGRAACRPRASRSSASRRRSTTTSPAPTSRSASTPRCRSRPTRSIACTR